jgi:hypothetical protein
MPFASSIVPQRLEETAHRAGELAADGVAHLLLVVFVELVDVARALILLTLVAPKIGAHSAGCFGQVSHLHRSLLGRPMRSGSEEAKLTVLGYLVNRIRLISPEYG